MEHELEYYKELILRRVKNILLHLPGHSKEVLDAESGREYVCSLCDVSLKPCTVHSGFLCCVALKAGTELSDLEAALDRLNSDVYGVCASCGKKIGSQYLKAHPATLLCERCPGKLSRVNLESAPIHQGRKGRRV